MDRWSLETPAWLRFALVSPILLLVTGVSGLCAYLAVELCVLSAIREGFSWLNFIIGIMILPFSPLMLMIPYINTKACFTEVLFSQEGIEQRIWGKRRKYIAWEDLAECGTTIDWSGRYQTKVLFFSDRPLTERERAVYSEDSANSIYVSCSDIWKNGGLHNLDKLETFVPYRFPRSEKTPVLRCIFN